MEPIIIRANATAKDINDAHYFHRSQTDMVAPGLLIFIFSSFFAVAFFVVTGLKKYPFLGAFEDIFHLICILISPAIPFLAIAIYQKIEKSRNFSKEHFLFLFPTTYVFGTDRVQVIAQDVTELYEWKDISRAYDAPASLIFTVGDVIFVIPKRDFSNYEQVKEVRQKLIDNIPEFSWVKGKRPKIEYFDSYQNEVSTGTVVPDLVLLDEAEKAQHFLVKARIEQSGIARLQLSYPLSAKQLSDSQWKFISCKKIAFVLALEFLFAGILCNVLIRQRHHTIQEEWQFAAIYFVALSCFVAYQFFHFKKQLEDASEDDFFEITLTEDSVLIKRNKSELNLDWGLLTEVIELEENYCLIFGKIEYFLLISKASITDEFKKMFVENLLKRKAVSYKN
ncbi:MAG: YcxB family protein [Cyanobacteria bacterium TGS_CYA1]|nr:YcxB family protein [Cyanobacteria bacterium TGS_CYA1]